MQRDGDTRILSDISCDNNQIQYIYKTKKYMKAQIFSLVKRGVLAIATLLMVASCDMWHTDTDDCPTGIYVKFKYDYNLQRADMFNDHVGAVTL